MSVQDRQARTRPLELVERPTPEPGPRQVRIKVEACGICHSDSFAVTGTFPGINYPDRAGSRGRRPDRCGRRGRHHLEGRAAGRRRLVRRQLRRLRPCRRGDFITCAGAESARHPSTTAAMPTT